MKRSIGFTISRMTCMALIALSFGSCLKSGSNVVTTTPKTYISILHLAPYTPAVEIYLNDTKASQGINPNTYFTAYSQVDPGAYDIKFKKASSDSLVAQIPAAVYDSLTFYTLLLYNDTQTSTKAYGIKDDFSSVTTASSSYRFFNMNPDAGSVDLYLNTTKAQSGRTPADNINSTTYNRFQNISDGYYSVVAKAAGTDSVVASATSISMQVGNVYTILLMGKGTSNTLNIVRAAY